MRPRVHLRLVWWLSATALAVWLAPGVEALDPTLHGPPDALAFGSLGGIAVFCVLARRRIPAAAVAALPRRRLAARAAVLTAKSAQEEALWRGLLLGLLAGPLGTLSAIVWSTLLFAGAHARRQGRAAVSQLVTGAAFGGVYVATGRLMAAIAAHASYNVLVGTGAMTEEDMSVSDTGRAGGRLVASGATPEQRRMTRPHPSATPVARLQGVVKAFGAVRALDGLDLDLYPGEVLALLGPNGAGKSTAVAVMLGLRRPDSGRAELHGADPRSAASRRAVGAVLQEVGFPPTLRVRELVALVRAHFPNAVSDRATLDRLDLSHLADRQAAGLSGGQKRRLAVALALAGNPSVLFLDEPTAGMDVPARRALLRDVAAFAAAGGAVLLTTQQLREAEEIATRVVVLVEGRTRLEGTVAEVRARGGLSRVTLRAARLPSLPGITSIDSQADRHVLLVEDADAVVAALVRSGVPFRELEVAPASLEDAFVAIATDGSP